MFENTITGPLLQCGPFSLDLSVPRVMGILNVTPDSFSDGGRYFADIDSALFQAEKMIAEGASIIDVGGESTRPGAQEVSESEEAERVLPIVERLGKEFEVVISVDTSTPALMKSAIAAGACMVNDVRALERKGAIDAVADSDCAICLMHMQGSPDSMQQSPRYDDPVADVRNYLLMRVAACEFAGIARKRIVLDPGFGFGKTLTHNLQLLNQLSAFASTGFPVLAGLSRKSMLGTLTGLPVDQRLHSSVAAAVLAVVRGARLIRCHDVGATVEAIKVAHAVITEGKGDE